MCYQQPYGMMLKVEIEECRTLRFNIPSPIKENTFVTVCTELRHRPDKQLTMEVWGELPENPSIPISGRRVLFASEVIPYPSAPVEDHSAFTHELTTSIIGNPAFTQAISTLLSMHISTATPAKESASNGQNPIS